MRVFEFDRYCHIAYSYEEMHGCPDCYCIINISPNMKFKTAKDFVTDVVKIYFLRNYKKYMEQGDKERALSTTSAWDMARSLCIIGVDNINIDELDCPIGRKTCDFLFKIYLLTALENLKMMGMLRAEKYGVHGTGIAYGIKDGWKMSRTLKALH